MNDLAHEGRRQSRNGDRLRSRRRARVVAAVVFGAAAALGAQTPLPDAPEARTKQAPTLGACEVRNQGATASAAGAARMLATAGLAPEDSSAQKITAPCRIYVPLMNWYARFQDGPRVKALTPRQKGWLAIRNVADPFNALTILGTSAISVASDPQSSYGPGMPGFGRLVGTSYAQDMTGEFFGTFLIPSIMHQDPHYHRAPGSSIPRRILHAATAVFWGQGDDGRGMLNYGNLIGLGADIAISNLYVPERETNFGASAVRYTTGLSLAPTDNLITEFLPDIARHIHFRVVFIQRIVNQVGRPETGGNP